MGLSFASLNSGSNGNCYYVGNDHDAVLIDAGISCRETEKRLTRLNLNMAKVRAIFISHEHSDHIKGLLVLSKKYQLPVYISSETLRHSGLNLQSDLVQIMHTDLPVVLGSLTIKPFLKVHDAIHPHSFIVSADEQCVGIFTDLGICCDELIAHFKRCDAAFLEANYDEEMLDKGRYPYFLKNRIRGGKGHLSNREALELFCKHRSDNLSHLILSHLSRDNNHPELVQKLFDMHTTNTEIIVASRYQETAVYQVGRKTAASFHSLQSPLEQQFSLF